jgi:hypothetical protein
MFAGTVSKRWAPGFIAARSPAKKPRIVLYVLQHIHEKNNIRLLLDLGQVLGHGPAHETHAPKAAPRKLDALRRPVNADARVVFRQGGHVPARPAPHVNDHGRL